MNERVLKPMMPWMIRENTWQRMVKIMCVREEQAFVLVKFRFEVGVRRLSQSRGAEKGVMAEANIKTDWPSKSPQLDFLEKLCSTGLNSIDYNKWPLEVDARAKIIMQEYRKDNGGPPASWKGCDQATRSWWRKIRKTAANEQLIEEQI